MKHLFVFIIAILSISCGLTHKDFDDVKLIDPLNIEYVTESKRMGIETEIMTNYSIHVYYFYVMVDNIKYSFLAGYDKTEILKNLENIFSIQLARSLQFFIENDPNRALYYMLPMKHENDSFYFRKTIPSYENDIDNYYLFKGEAAYYNVIPYTPEHSEYYTMTVDEYIKNIIFPYMNSALCKVYKADLDEIYNFVLKSEF